MSIQMRAVEGVDMEAAFRRFDGDESIFFDVLRSYLSGTRPLLDRLREALAASDLEDYAITIHGIKGSSYGIAAQRAGEAAQALETAAKAGDIVAVKKGHAEFESLAASLLDAIDKALTGLCRELPVAETPDPELLREMKDACAAFDMDRADAAMEKLETLRYESDMDLVVWLRQKMNDMAFEEIAGMRIPDAIEHRSDAKELRAGMKGEYSFTAPEASVLIVDDNDACLAAAKALLGPMLLRADTAESGEKALLLAREKRYHLIFIDYMMPALDGAEVTRLLRRRVDEHFWDVPVIGMTACEEPRIMKLLLEAGMNDLITKPVDRKSLAEALRRWLPKELIHEQSAQETGEPLAEQTDGLPAIEGIDAADGVRFSGGRQLFLRHLGDFYKLIDLKSAGLQKSLEAGKLDEVTTQAHSLKTTARMIGAAELSQRLGLIEKYANDRDAEALKREMPGALEHYRSFKHRLAPFDEAAERERRPAMPKEFVARLGDLISAAARFDIDAADLAVRRLTELEPPEEQLAGIETLQALVADVALQEAQELAENMILTLENKTKRAPGIKIEEDGKCN